VHSVVSFDFATSVIPGWHTTIFPPYFVAGAVFSGFAMVMTLMIIARQVFGLKELMTMKHLEYMNKIMLVTGSLVGYAYGMEFFIAWYSGNEYERYAFINRAFGPYWWAYWTMLTCNVVSPQLFWFKRCRTSLPIMFAISIVINIGMWFERFVIIVTSLHRDYLPSSWGYFSPTIVDIGCFLGSLGLFFTLFALFIRWIPQIAMFEVKAILPGAQPSHLHAHEQEVPSHAPHAMPAKGGVS
jgi:Ni/Fe-hydrogenase subunit HybB-like protein